jgi:hypothetical protein
MTAKSNSTTSELEAASSAAQSPTPTAILPNDDVSDLIASAAIEDGTEKTVSGPAASEPSITDEPQVPSGITTSEADLPNDAVTDLIASAVTEDEADRAPPSAPSLAEEPQVTEMTVTSNSTTSELEVASSAAQSPTPTADLPNYDVSDLMATVAIEDGTERTLSGPLPSPPSITEKPPVPETEPFSSSSTPSEAALSAAQSPTPTTVLPNDDVTGSAVKIEDRTERVLSGPPPSAPLIKEEPSVPEMTVTSNSTTSEPKADTSGLQTLLENNVQAAEAGLKDAAEADNGNQTMTNNQPLETQVLVTNIRLDKASPGDVTHIEESLSPSPGSSGSGNISGNLSFVLERDDASPSSEAEAVPNPVSETTVPMIRAMSGPTEDDGDMLLFPTEPEVPEPLDTSYVASESPTAGVAPLGNDDALNSPILPPSTPIHVEKDGVKKGKNAPAAGDASTARRGPVPTIIGAFVLATISAVLLALGAA